MKTIIVSAHCSRTDLIEIQFKSIKHFVQGECEYYVFNDAKPNGDLTNFNNKNIRSEINKICSDLKIPCIEVPQEHHKNRRMLFPDTKEISNDHPCTRAAISFQYMYNYFANTKDIMFVLLDADMFFIDYIDFNIYSSKDILFVPQAKHIYEYMWIGVVIINNNNVTHLDKICWDCGKVNDTPVDTGGQSYHWLHKYNKDLCIKLIDHHIKTNIDTNIHTEYPAIIVDLCNKIVEFKKCNNINLEFLLSNKILHLRSSGSNWDYTNESFKEYVKTNNKKLSLTENWKNYQKHIGSIVHDFMNTLIALT